MYNLTVDEAHTFFIGDGEWLVHNCLDGEQMHLGDAPGGDDFDDLRPGTGNASNIAGTYGDQRLAELFPNGYRQALKTRTGDVRIIDRYDPISEIGREVKTGNQPYFKDPERVFVEIAKDLELIYERQVAGVEWHFFPNHRGQGPRISPELQQALDLAGIPYFIHPK